MSFNDREEKILNILNEKSFVRSSELAKMLYVSVSTLRRDLEKLEKKTFYTIFLIISLLFNAIGLSITVIILLIGRKRQTDILNKQLSDIKERAYYEEN